MTNMTQGLVDRRNKAVAKGVFNLAPLFVDKARGALLTDVEGREFIDFVGGIGVANIGHNHPQVVAAIKDQADKVLHSCFHIAMYEGYVALAEKLVSLTPGNFEKKAVLLNSGAEAVENAIKIARYATGRTGVVAFENGFHGRTLLSMTLTSKVKPYKFGFGPFAPEVYRIPFAYCYRCPLGREYPGCDIGCSSYLEDMFINHAAAEHIACLIVEPVSGEGGFIAPPPEYFARLKKICKEHGILFIADEVQTCAGRTGTMFAMEQWSVEPDITTMAKSMGGGMPISAVVGRAEIMDAPHVGGLGGTYGGNPVSCAAALAALTAIEEEDILARSKALGTTVYARFEELQNRHALVGDVRGKGAMLAMELVESRKTKEPATAKTKALVQYCHDNGLLVLACGQYGNVIRTLMPLTITEEHLDQGLDILDKGLAAVAKG